MHKIVSLLCTVSDTDWQMNLNFCYSNTDITTADVRNSNIQHKVLVASWILWKLDASDHTHMYDNQSRLKFPYS